LEADIGLPLSGEVNNPVAGDAEEPGDKILAVIPVESPDGPQPDILEDVIGPVGVVDHAENKPVERTPCLFDNALQGVGLALPILGQQVFKVRFLHVV